MVVILDQPCPINKFVLTELRMEEMNTSHSDDFDEV